MITAKEFMRVLAEMLSTDAGRADVVWADSCKLPETPEDFAREAIFVICNSGMKHTVAQRIFDRVMNRVFEGGSAFDVFKHQAKAQAIDGIWHRRVRLHGFCLARARVSDTELIDFCAELPWIGKITKFHLAKNFGAQVAKPDVHLQRLADRERCTAQELCERLGRECGEKVATVDVVLWRACATGIINSRTGEMRVREFPG